MRVDLRAAPGLPLNVIAAIFGYSVVILTVFAVILSLLCCYFVVICCYHYLVLLFAAICRYFITLSSREGQSNSGGPVDLDSFHWLLGVCNYCVLCGLQR